MSRRARGASAKVIVRFIFYQAFFGLSDVEQDYIVLLVKLSPCPARQDCNFKARTVSADRAFSLSGESAIAFAPDIVGMLYLFTPSGKDILFTNYGKYTLATA